MMPEAHPDVLERLEAEPAGDPGRRYPAEQVVGLVGDHQRPPDHHTQQRDQHPGADETELLAGDGEDEVGVLFGDESDCVWEPSKSP